MKEKNGIVVASAAGAIAISPFWAYRFRSSEVLGSYTREEWFVSMSRGGDGIQTFLSIVIASAVAGIAAGLLLRKMLHSADDAKEFKLTLLRTPIAAAVLVPIGFAVILFIAYNHTADAFEQIVMPEFYAKNWLLCSAALALISAVLVGLLNIFEHAFDQSSIPTKAGILCCSPLAIAIGFSLLAGMIGLGGLCGLGIGRFYECPISGAWTGTCLAIAFLAVEGGILWPIYFPMTRHSVE